MVQWIRNWTLNHVVPGSNPHSTAFVPLGKALYPHCLVLREDIKPLGYLLTSCCFLPTSHVRQLQIQSSVFDFLITVFEY